MSPSKKSCWTKNIYGKITRHKNRTRVCLPHSTHHPKIHQRFFTCSLNRRPSALKRFSLACIKKKSSSTRKAIFSPIQPSSNDYAKEKGKKSGRNIKRQKHTWRRKKLSKLQPLKDISRVCFSLSLEQAGVSPGLQIHLGLFIVFFLPFHGFSDSFNFFTIPSERRNSLESLSIFCAAFYEGENIKRGAEELCREPHGRSPACLLASFTPSKVRRKFEV